RGCGRKHGGLFAESGGLLSPAAQRHAQRPGKRPRRQRPQPGDGEVLRRGRLLLLWPAAVEPVGAAEDDRRDEARHVVAVRGEVVGEVVEQGRDGGGGGRGHLGGRIDPAAAGGAFPYSIDERPREELPLLQADADQLLATAEPLRLRAARARRVLQRLAGQEHHRHEAFLAVLAGVLGLAVVLLADVALAAGGADEEGGHAV